MQAFFQSKNSHLNQTSFGKQTDMRGIHGMYNQTKCWTQDPRSSSNPSTGSFTDDNKRKLFSLDVQFTEISLGAEKTCSCRCTQKNQWSPTLQTVGRKVVYWKRRCTLQGEVDPRSKALGLQAECTLNYPYTRAECKTELDEAYTQLKTSQLDAVQNRKAHLKTRAEEKTGQAIYQRKLW